MGRGCSGSFIFFHAQGEPVVPGLTPFLLRSSTVGITDLASGTMFLVAEEHPQPLLAVFSSFPEGTGLLGQT